MDGTIAHYTGVMPPDDSIIPDCALLARQQIDKASRDDALPANFLCDLHAYSSTSVTEQRNTNSRQLLEYNILQLLEPNSSTNRFPEARFVRCPDGHMTHLYLACDVQSACFALDSRTSVSCRAPLTPLPPSFTCNNGVQHVPYTLVCDHRSDCSDRSDERFCVFTPCNVTSQFECKNKEVGKLLALTSSKSSSSLLRLDLVILFLLDMTLATDMSSNIKKPIPSSTPKT